MIKIETKHKFYKYLVKFLITNLILKFRNIMSYVLIICKLYLVIILMKLI